MLTMVVRVRLVMMMVMVISQFGRRRCYVDQDYFINGSDSDIWVDDNCFCRTQHL